MECRVLKEAPEEEEIGPERETLILFDSQNRYPFDNVGVMNEVPEYIKDNCLLALLNVPGENGTELLGLKFGIHGIISTDDSPKNFIFSLKQ